MGVSHGYPISFSSSSDQPGTQGFGHPMNPVCSHVAHRVDNPIDYYCILPCDTLFHSLPRKAITVPRDSHIILGYHLRIHKSAPIIMSVSGVFLVVYFWAAWVLELPTDYHLQLLINDCVLEGVGDISRYARLFGSAGQHGVYDTLPPILGSFFWRRSLFQLAIPTTSIIGSI